MIRWSLVMTGTPKPGGRCEWHPLDLRPLQDMPYPLGNFDPQFSRPIATSQHDTGWTPSASARPIRPWLASRAARLRMRTRARHAYPERSRCAIPLLFERSHAAGGGAVAANDCRNAIAPRWRPPSSSARMAAHGRGCVKRPKSDAEWAANRMFGVRYLVSLYSRPIDVMVPPPAEARIGSQCGR